VHQIPSLAFRLGQPCMRIQRNSCLVYRTNTRHWAVEFARFPLTSGSGKCSMPNMLQLLLCWFILHLCSWDGGGVARGGRDKKLLQMFRTHLETIRPVYIFLFRKRRYKKLDEMRPGYFCRLQMLHSVTYSLKHLLLNELEKWFAKL
jgi:hypothetical protein